MRKYAPLEVAKTATNVFCVLLVRVRACIFQLASASGDDVSSAEQANSGIPLFCALVPTVRKDDIQMFRSKWLPNANTWVVLRAIQFTCTPLRVLMRTAQRGVRCAKLAQRSQAKVSNRVLCVAQVT